MEKFRVISDLHLDINEHYPIELDDDVFTVICGDTSGYNNITIDWIKKNVKSGVGVSGNHLPYNKYNLPIQELRDGLANAFPITAPFTYLDCETNTFSKEVDGILFIGTCMYTNMRISHKYWNPTGDIQINMAGSEYNMNDYHWGIKSCTWPFGKDNSPSIKHITAQDYADWFKNAYNKIEAVLNDNESSTNPKPVVLITHHPVITNFLKHNWYVEDPDTIWSIRHYNLASYMSDMHQWLSRHTSIKCYCCGHIHAVDKNWRSFNLKHIDGSEFLVVNNARGYVKRCHDTYFNKNTFVNTKTWQVEQLELDEKEKALHKQILNEEMKNLAWLI